MTMLNIIIFRIIIIIFIFYSSLAFASDGSIKYRIQVILLCNTNYYRANAIRAQAENNLGVKAYLAFHNGCYKIVVGDYKSFREASVMIGTVRNHYPDAWIAPSYNEFIVLSVKTVEEGIVETSELTKAVIALKDELHEIKQVLGDMLLVFNDINSKIKTNEETQSFSDMDSWAIPPDDLIAAPTEQHKTVSIKQRKKSWFYASGGIAYADLHKERPDIHYANYLGYCAGIGFSYAIMPYLALDLSADYSYLNAVAAKDIHTVDGNASFIRVNPSIMFGTDINNRFRFYGKLGASYFNYDYAFEMTLKPGQSNGPSSIYVELVTRASDFGVNAGVGVRMFRYVDLYFGSYFDYNSRRYHHLSLGITF